MSCPKVVIIPGGFCLPLCFDGLVKCLTKKKIPTAVLSLPSCNPADANSMSCAKDVEHVHRSLTELIDESHENILIFAHSYGAAVVGAAAVGLSQPGYASKGMTGGVIGLVFLAGSIVKEDETLLQAVGGNWPEYINTDHPSPGLCTMSPTVFGVESVDTAAILGSGTAPHASAAFTTPVPKSHCGGRFSSEYAARLGYIRTLSDDVFPLPVQDRFMQRIDTEWTLEEIDSGHGAFISKPEEVAYLLKKYIVRWAI